MLEEAVRRVVRAKGSAHCGDGDSRRLAIVPNKRHDFFPQIGIENGLDVAAVKRVRALVVKTLTIDRIDGKEFDFPGVDEVRKSADHALTFEFPLVAGAGWESEKS